MMIQTSAQILDLRRDTACIADVEASMAAQFKQNGGVPGLLGSDASRAAAYHLASGGQRVRAQLALDAAFKLDMPAQDAIALAACVELLHNASLIHDDLQDRSRSRRDRAAVWHLYGDSVAVCAGDLLISAAYRALSTFSGTHLLPDLFALTHNCIAQSIKGQCADLSASSQFASDIDRYVAVAMAKSGALLSLPLELVLASTGFGQAVPVACKAARAFAVGYQIADDMADIEEDVADINAHPSPNILLVLQSAGYGVGTFAAARSMGLAHLVEAASTAETLPSGAGEFLRTLALRLAARL